MNLTRHFENTRQFERKRWVFVDFGVCGAMWLDYGNLGRIRSGLDKQARVAFCLQTDWQGT